MQTKHFGKGILLAGVWAYAAATWASIGHYVIGLPDLVAAAAVGGAAGAATWTVARSRRTGVAAPEAPTARLILK
jgi:hypothetical protein